MTAYAKIWTGLVKLEDWLKRELVAIIGSGDIDPSRWAVIFDTYNGFRGEMLFLPDLLYERTGRLMTTLEQNINGLIDALRKASALQHGDPTSYAANQEQLLKLINSALSKVAWSGSAHDTSQVLHVDIRRFGLDVPPLRVVGESLCKTASFKFAKHIRIQLFHIHIGVGGAELTSRYETLSREHLEKSLFEALSLEIHHRERAKKLC